MHGMQREGEIGRQKLPLHACLPPAVPFLVRSLLITSTSLLLLPDSQTSAVEHPSHADTRFEHVKAPPRHDDFESVDCDDDFEGKLRQQLQELIHSEEEEGLQIPDSLSSSSSYSSSSIGPVGNSCGHKFDELIPEVDIYKHEPWDLPAKCHLPTSDSKWHFFNLRDRKYPNGSRSNRATEEGYWKSTGRDRNVKFQNQVIGTKKTLVFHEGRPPCGKRTDWIMHEYYIDEKECKAAKDAFVLCRVTKRNGWQVEIEKIEPIMGCKESSHSGEIDDIDAWVAELFDPDFGAPSNDFKTPSNDFGTSSNVLEHEAEISQADLSSLLPKQEPVDHYIDQSAEGDTDYLLEGPAAELTSRKIRLQVSKMESRGSASVNHTVKIDKEDRHLDLKKSHNTDLSAFHQESAVGKLSVCFYQADAKSNPSSGSNLPCSVASRSLVGARPATDVTLQKSIGALDDASCIRGILRSLGMLVRALSSAGRNCFILGACIIGIAALLICLLLRDARGFLGSFSSLWL
ncbi:hypothetical protein OPV22_005173 [Ensete ventricosum]|uniref:NAC domain-containing protein n=1 Tax=Ensete ventricosum TaxID=4639 RepID=A0AAV8RIH3_ENSVE|nr:hypothetical protein OPV22_005173 [Ensete ventricosum]